MALSALAIAGIGFSVFGTSQKNKAAANRAESDAKAALFEAQILDILAGQEEAVGQSRALEQRRLGRLRSSTALARSAASGGGVATEIIADLDAQTELLARLELFSGKDRARTRRLQARSKRIGGFASAQIAKDIKSSTIFDIGTSLFDKFG